MENLVSYGIVKKSGVEEFVNITEHTAILFNVCKDLGLTLGLNGTNPSIKKGSSSIAWLDRGNVKSPQLNGVNVDGSKASFVEVLKSDKPFFDGQTKVTFNYTFRSTKFPEFYCLELSNVELSKEEIVSFAKSLTK